MHARHACIFLDEATSCLSHVLMGPPSCASTAPSIRPSPNSLPHSLFLPFLVFNYCIRALSFCSILLISKAFLYNALEVGIVQCCQAPPQKSSGNFQYCIRIVVCMAYWGQSSNEARIPGCTSFFTLECLIPKVWVIPYFSLPRATRVLLLLASRAVLARISEKFVWIAATNILGSNQHEKETVQGSQAHRIIASPS
jgi:hypothetical protein